MPVDDWLRLRKAACEASMSVSAYILRAVAPPADPRDSYRYWRNKGAA